MNGTEAETSVTCENVHFCNVFPDIFQIMSFCTCIETYGAKLHIIGIFVLS